MSRLPGGLKHCRKGIHTFTGKRCKACQLASNKRRKRLARRAAMVKKKLRPRVLLHPSKKVGGGRWPTFVPGRRAEQDKAVQRLHRPLRPCPRCGSPNTYGWCINGVCEVGRRTKELCVV